MSALGVSLILIAWQTVRVVRRDRRLQTTNVALSDANKELFAVNTSLQEKTDALENSNRELNDANVQIQGQTERKSRFLASMSHELRTPMNAIIGFTNMVLRRAGDVLPERQKGNLEKVVIAANRLLELINGLLDLSKIEAGRMDVNIEKFEVKTLIDACCAEVDPLVKPGVALVRDVGEDVGEAETDRGRLHQVVMNLLSNGPSVSIKRSPKCQQLEVTYIWEKREKAPPIHLISLSPLRRKEEKPHPSTPFMGDLIMLTLAIDSCFY